MAKTNRNRALAVKQAEKRCGRRALGTPGAQPRIAFGRQRLSADAAETDRIDARYHANTMAAATTPATTAILAPVDIALTGRTLIRFLSMRARRLRATKLIQAFPIYNYKQAALPSTRAGLWSQWPAQMSVLEHLSW
jgi:hypothetical protein